MPCFPRAPSVGSRATRASGSPPTPCSTSSPGAGFYVFCHDDAAPEPQAVSALVAAAERWHADIVGPKLVRWDDRHRFTQFGLTVDKVGESLPYVLHGELDQGQHDGLHDVFAVPGAFTLVRASRFAEIGGFDEEVTFRGDDLSLSWRAWWPAPACWSPRRHVRHAEAGAVRADGIPPDRLAARHPGKCCSPATRRSASCGSSRRPWP